ncbi:MAG: hypothetical protein H7X99_05805, partial [Saprospiraceae bacterium]|nr:hypothetical protein [Saprospiraceae bacterium]
ESAGSALAANAAVYSPKVHGEETKQPICIDTISIDTKKKNNIDFHESMNDKFTYQPYIPVGTKINIYGSRNQFQ